jgi:TolA-binding protein
MKIILLLSLLVVSTSCFKTAEEIKREQQMETQVNQSSQMVAELTLQLKDLQTKLANATGQIEEVGHHAKTQTEQTTMTFTQTIAQLSEQVKALTEENKQNKLKISALEKEVESQKDYIQKVNSTLSKMAGGSSSSKSSKVSAASSNSLADAHKLFEKSKQKEALELYLQLIDSGKLSAANANHAYYNTGLLYFWKKDYDNALIYFSKIYTKYPKSSWAPRSLIQIARSFKAQGKTAEANATYEEFLKNYPKDNLAKEAKEEMK